MVASRRRPPSARPPPLAYASVGSTGMFANKGDNKDDDAAQTWTFTLGVGWLYGLGLCIGPFFGTGVGFTVPGGVLAGAGGGVGVVVGIGMGSGVVWGTGRGVVQGLGVIPPMTPPFAEGLPRFGDLPAPRELARRAADGIDDLRASVARRTAERRAVRARPAAVEEEPLALVPVTRRAWKTSHGHRRHTQPWIKDPRWISAERRG